MRITHYNPDHRPAKVLVLFVLLLTVLIGLLGLVIDSGMMMASHRRTQNIADSVALAIAMHRMRGGDDVSTEVMARKFVKEHFGISEGSVSFNGKADGVAKLDAEVQIHLPPVTAGSPHAGNDRYVEVIVNRPYSTMFVQVVGATQNQQVTARAVAGHEPASTGEGVIVLDPTVAPGLSMGGQNTYLKVNGSVFVNSPGAGDKQVDQYGDIVPGPVQGVSAALVLGGLGIEAKNVVVVGGMNDADYPVLYKTVGNTSTPCPVFCRMPVQPDPLQDIPIPKVLSPTPTNLPSVSASTNSNIAVEPGVYADISISGGTVVFNPGIYVVSPQKGGDGLKITGGTVTTNRDSKGGMMIFLAGSDYLADPANPGASDVAAGRVTTKPTFKASDKIIFPTVTINGGTGELYGRAYETKYENDRILIFQSRRNTTGASVGGSSSPSVNGAIYAKWALFSLAGNGTYDSQFIVGSLSIQGGASLTINGTGVNRGRANQVFLVE